MSEAWERLDKALDDLGRAIVRAWDPLVRFIMPRLKWILVAEGIVFLVILVLIAETAS